MIRPFAIATLTALSGAFVYGAYVVMAGASAVALPACTDTDGSTGVTPITGIVVRSESLTAGHGCGEQAGQVYKYAAVVTLAADAGTPEDAGPGAPIAQGIYDCFADGTFANLPANANGSTTFTVYIYGFDYPTWNANQASINCAGVTGISLPGSCVGVDAAAFGTGGVAAVNFDEALTSLATWRTTCTAAQVSDIEVIAACNALANVQ